MATKISVKNESILENIIETLQCFKCKAVPGITQEQQNRYTCVNESHQLCEKCKSVCQCGSVVVKRPNPTTKKLLKDLPVYCPHYNNGCRQIFVQTQAESLDDHQQGCLFNKVFCPDLYCKKKVKNCQGPKHHLMETMTKILYMKMFTHKINTQLRPTKIGRAH